MALEASMFALRAPGAFSPAALDVDAENGVIRGCTVMCAGEACGHGFSLDATTLQQLADAINAQPDGVLVRFKHPEERPDGSMVDSLGTDVGRIKNARVSPEGPVRADVHLGAWAKNLPVLGDVWSYLLTKASTDPRGIGLSAVFRGVVETLSDAKGLPTQLVARITELQAVDFVGRGAATPNGLLAAVDAANRTMTHPIYWFARLDQARRSGDVAVATNAVAKLRCLGIRVSYDRVSKPTTPAKSGK